MTTRPFPADLMAALHAMQPTLATQGTILMQSELPVYAAIPYAALLASNQRTLDQMIAMMDKSNFPVARAYFEELTMRRDQAGIAMADFLRAIDLMVSVVAAYIAQEFAADPPYRDRALRLLQSGTVFTRAVVGRRHLRAVVQQVPASRPSG